MEKKLCFQVIIILLLLKSALGFTQTPNLGSASDFILFTSSGALGNTGVSEVLGGAVGTDFGAITGFESVNCLKHNQNEVTAQCKLDLLAVFTEISAITTTQTLANLTGGTYFTGVYHVTRGGCYLKPDSRCAEQSKCPVYF
ncbi:MAG: hypothetical protein IPH20_20135 [Bacteroidales bacterium]|nr:hypothetical protein [Bacteroidales bacterium]